MNLNQLNNRDIVGQSQAWALFNSFAKLLFGRSWKLSRKHRIPEKKLTHLIQRKTANELRHASGPIHASTRYIHANLVILATR